MTIFVAIASCLITLFGIFIGQRLGFWQLTIATKAHDLNVRLAAPKIGTSITIDERYDNGKNYAPFLYLTATIYNEGQLPIVQLKGDWNLSPQCGVKNCTVPFQRDALGSTPYQLQPYRLAETGDLMSKNVRFDVNIQFEYLSPPDNQPHQYSARYSYDPNIKQMLRQN